MPRTPKYDKEVRDTIYGKILPLVNAELGDDGILTEDGYAYVAGKDTNGVERVFTVKVIVKSDEYSIEDALAESEEKATKKAEAEKAKAEKLAKAKEKASKKKEG